MDNNKNALPFGIDFVVKEDLGNIEGFRTWKAAGSSYDITCPFCDGKRKMNINTAKNLAKCNKCGGGKGYNLVTLHAALTGLSNPESFKDLMKRWNGLNSDVKSSFKITESSIILNEPAPIEIRDKVYRRFLSNLSLSEKHFNNLIKRGLNKEQIERGLYKSVPSIGLHSLAYNAVYESGIFKELENHKYWGIPGFTDIYNPEKISIRGRKPGFFVPIIQKDGYISGMQIRYDNLPKEASLKEKEEYKKYSWYSSSEKETGCSVTGCENIHFAGDWKHIPKVINLTEGVLKADVASALSAECFLGLVGVNNVSQLEKTLLRLQYLGAESVNLYIDMDYKYKKEVAAALLSIKKIINSVGRHAYKIIEANGYEVRPFNNKIRDNTACFQKGIDFVAQDAYPKDLSIQIGNTLVPKDKFKIFGTNLYIDNEYIRYIRNGTHILKLLREEDLSVFSSIAFSKSGLKYKELNWNSAYKGIDDYYLYLKSLK